MLLVFLRKICGKIEKEVFWAKMWMRDYHFSISSNFGLPTILNIFHHCIRITLRKSDCSFHESFP